MYETSENKNSDGASDDVKEFANFLRYDKSIEIIAFEEVLFF